MPISKLNTQMVDNKLPHCENTKENVTFIIRIFGNGHISEFF